MNSGSTAHGWATWISENVSELHNNAMKLGSYLIFLHQMYNAANGIKVILNILTKQWSKFVDGKP